MILRYTVEPTTPGKWAVYDTQQARIVGGTETTNESEAQMLCDALNQNNPRER